MSASKIVAGVAVWMFIAAPMVAQQHSNNSSSKLDSKITAAMQKVSVEKLRADDEKLVSFGTRHTLSVQLPDSSNIGIKKAAAWIQEQFESYSKACGGCLEAGTG